MPKKTKDTIRAYNADKQVVKEMSIYEFWDLIWWTWCWAWMKFCNDNKETAWDLMELYQKNKHEINEKYDQYRLSLKKWKKEHIDLCSRMPFYVSLEDKELLIDKYPDELDKMIKIFWEERIESWFDYIIDSERWPIFNMSDMFIWVHQLDERIEKWYDWEKAYDTYRKELEEYQAIHKFTS